MKSNRSILNYLKRRASTLQAIIEYYETLERDRGFMKSDDMLSYSIAQAQMNEIERLVDYIEK